MKKKLIIFVYLIFLLLSTDGQSKYYDYNKSQIELLRKAIDTSCKDYNSERPVSKKMIRWDKKIIAFLNDVYNKNLTLSEIKSSYAKLSPQELRFHFSDTNDLGGFKRYETPIYSEGNIKVEILLIATDDLILYKRIRFETKRRTSCFEPPTFGISYYDVKYLDELCLQLIDFPMSIKKWPFISAEKSFSDNLRQLKAKGYRSFDLDSTKQLEDLIFFQTILYDFRNPSWIVKDLYKNNKVDSLIEFLYNPNHIVALNATEALLALNKIKNIPLTIEVLNKMELIKNLNIKISWQSSDVHYHEKKTYKELNPSEDRILKKYKDIQ